MRIFAYATHSNHRLDKLRELLEVELLPVSGEWTGDFYQKANSFNSVIQELPDDEIVALIDAFDVLPANGCTNQKLKDALLENFSMEKVVFNAEKNCYPDGDLAIRYPHTNSSWRYLNAGILAGKISVLKHLYSEVLDKIPKSMDQLQFSIAFLNGAPIELDNDCKVFQTLYMTSEEEISYSKEGIKNNVTGTYPLLIHGNGNASMDKVYLQYES